MYCHGLSVEYYDPLDDKVIPSVFRDITDFVKAHYDILLKFKEN